MAAVPYLYVEGHAASNPVLLSGPLSTQFLWDAKLGVHVHRFKDLADFRVRCKEILRDEPRWKLIPGIDDEEEGEVEDERDPELLALQLAACQALAEGEAITFVEAIANHPAVKAVKALTLTIGVLDAGLKLLKSQGPKGAPGPRHTPSKPWPKAPAKAKAKSRRR